ncbi:uncharacterized protein LOC131931959 [Physella acuta]|uniref:uncharacterized protein LOC131931959 n=1 Tax=Physella acuta TaxID=109671 RepID=UPI0027DABC1A|nr:uncharacterized protein LOC131931959 [Physella acuta]
METTFAEALKTSLAPRLLIVEDDSEDDSVEAESQPWDCLPYNVLVKICSFLQGRDRCKMAQVCTTWNEATKNPTLWRNHVFYLYSNSEAPRGLSWLSSRVHYLQNATIMCFGNFDRYRDKFLRALQRADLLNLDINGTAYWWSATPGKSTCTRVIARIIRLLKTQRRLVGFQMRQAMLDFAMGMDLLDAIAASSGDSLLRLGLEDFFGDDIVLSSPSVPERFTRCMMRFPNLNDFTINYEYLTDHLLNWLTEIGRNRVIHLNVVSWLANIPIPIVSRQAWSAMSRFSNVRVYLILQNIRSIKDVTRAVLLPGIPMYRLDLVGIAALGDEDVQDMVDMLQHVSASYAQTIAGFRMWSDNNVCEEIETAILNMLEKTTSLTYLDLHMDVHAQFMGTLCTLQMKKVIKLQTLRLARSLTDYLEFEGFRREVKQWFPFLKQMKIDFHIRAESAPNHSAWNEYVFIIADTAGIVDSEEDSAPTSGNQNANNKNNNNSISFPKWSKFRYARPHSFSVASQRTRERARVLKNRISV